MLNIINNLAPFFEDCYRRINVREYSRIMKFSPPTASKMLFDFNKNGLLLMEKDRNYLFFYANKASKIFIDLSRIYWSDRLKELISYLDKNLVDPVIILFGSLSKAETTSNSDIDLAIFANKKSLDLKNFEVKIKRNIQLFWFSSIKEINNKDLANNILNGYILGGKLKV